MQHVKLKQTIEHTTALMIRFEKTMITFTEVPDEISLCINCTCCPLRCKGCFEPWLRENSGEILTKSKLSEIL